MRRSVMPILVLVAVLAAAAPAGAQTGSIATPSTAGKAGTLRFGLDAAQPPVNGLVPDKLALVAPGFTYDPRAVGGRCTHLQATLNECPRSSRIGGGGLVLHVFMPDGTQRDANPTLDIYLAKGSTTKILAVAFVAGYRVVPGTIDTTGGFTVRFDPLPKPPAFPGVTYALRGISLSVGTSRVVKRYRTTTVRRKGKKHRVRKLVGRKRYDLLHNPAVCPGTWPSAMLLGFPDASQLTVQTPTACTS